MTIATPDRPLTAKQEAFTQAWLTNGFSAVLAYQTAYNSSNMQPATIRKEAVRVLQTPAIQLRIEQDRAGNPLVPVPVATHDPRPAVRDLPSKPEKPDKVWLLSEAVDLLILAKHTGNLAQVRSALELIGKITGDLVDRKELRVVRSWSDLTDAEVDALAAGETIDATISDEACDPNVEDEIGQRSRDRPCGRPM
jgi:hypothetical protein